MNHTYYYKRKVRLSVISLMTDSDAK